jgi:Domain of unknown function (DUF6484)
MTVTAPQVVAAAPASELERLLDSPRPFRPETMAGAMPSPVVGVLVAFADPSTPLVVTGAADGPALQARTSIDLAPEHIGHEVLLVFERGDPARPIVIGRVRKATGWPTRDAPAQVEVDADGRRLTLAVKEQLVLRCGQASITLTAAGKVLIEGAYVSSRSTGVNRIKGGSVQIN